MTPAAHTRATAAGAALDRANRTVGGLLAADALRILLVEDNPTSGQVVELLLGRLGCRADVVLNGHDAVAAVHAGDYDLVLMDVQMPVMDGLDATRLIRHDLPAVRQPHIVALTAGATLEDQTSCRQAGMDGYLSKPVRRDRLAAVVDRVRGLAPAHEPESSPAAPAPGGREQALQLRLAELRGPDLPQDDELVAQLLRNFLSRAQLGLDALDEAVGHGDAGAVEHLAHAIAGAAANTGAAHVAQLLGDLERHARAGELGVAHELLRRARTELAEVQPLLLAAASGLQPG